jgi:plastocyanin domain-containing protein
MEETIAINKSFVWKAGAGLFGVLFVISLFTNGFGLVNNNEMTGNVVKDGVVEIDTILQGFSYNPDTITVKKGSRVRLTIDNRDNVLHGLHLPQFGINGGTPPLSKKTVEFIAIETPNNGQALPTCSQEHGEKLTINVI